MTALCSAAGVGCSKESISVKASLIVSAWLASLTRLIGPCLIIDVGVASVSRFVVYLRYFEEITYEAYRPGHDSQLCCALDC